MVDALLADPWRRVGIFLPVLVAPVRGAKLGDVEPAGRCDEYEPADALGVLESQGERDDATHRLGDQVNAAVNGATDAIGEIPKAGNLGIARLVSSAWPVQECLSPTIGEAAGNREPELGGTGGPRKEHQAALLVAHHAHVTTGSPSSQSRQKRETSALA